MTAQKIISHACCKIMLLSWVSSHYMSMQCKTSAAGLDAKSTRLSVKPKLWKMQLWNYNNFIFWILNPSVSSEPVGTIAFSGNILLWKGAHPVLAGRNSDLLLFISFLFIPSTSLFKTQKQFRRNKQCVCCAWEVWSVFAKNQSFMKWKLGQQSLT